MTDLEKMAQQIKDSIKPEPLPSQNKAGEQKAIEKNERLKEAMSELRQKGII